MGETYIRVNGDWKYLYRAVDKQGQTVDFLLSAPNGVKVTIMLEELLALGHSGAEYDAWLIRIHDGDQFGSGFVGANPSSKIPALVDHSGETPVRVFESGAILQYLAEKFDALLPASGAARAECLFWLFWPRLPHENMFTFKDLLSGL